MDIELYVLNFDNRTKSINLTKFKLFESLSYNYKQSSQCTEHVKTMRQFLTFFIILSFSVCI